MTCCAYRDGIIAADRLLCDDYGTRFGQRSKIFRARGGAVYACAGEVSAIGWLFAWVDSGELLDNRPEFKTHQALCIKGRKVSVSAGTRPCFVEVDAPYYAIGSGSNIALGAMYMGATAEEAVRAAIVFDVYCGGEIDVVRLYEEPNEFRPPETKPSDLLPPYGVRPPPIHVGGPR